MKYIDEDGKEINEKEILPEPPEEKKATKVVKYYDKSGKEIEKPKGKVLPKDVRVVEKLIDENGRKSQLKLLQKQRILLSAILKRLD